MGTSQFISGEQGNRYPPWEGLKDVMQNALTMPYCFEDKSRHFFRVRVGEEVIVGQVGGLLLLRIGLIHNLSDL